ncbi:YdcF family protein [Candidatus Saccharibacteria bacterium]|jgi:hypothetical protein|nr:YdcF family protein [Candidatus Saccharibacteria bacterium]
MSQQRSSNLELPKATEVLEMIGQVESPRLAVRRDLVEDCLQKGTFDAIRELQAIAGTPYLFAINRDVDSEESFCEAMLQLHESTNTTIQALSEGAFDPELLERVYGSLAEQDEAEVVDLIFVFGAPSNARVEKAVDLYKLGLAPKILISGRGPNWDKAVTSTEAEMMGRRAEELGVPASDIFLETKAVSIPDNVKRGVDLLAKESINPEKIIIVASAFGLLRASIDWKKFAPYPIKLVKASPPILDPNLGKELWHTNEAGRRVVINEYAKIVNEAIIDELVLSEYGSRLLAQNKKAQA